MSTGGEVAVIREAAHMVRDSSVLDMPYRILVSAIVLLSIGTGRPIENVGQNLQWFQLPDYLSRDDSWLSLAQEWIHAVPLLSHIAALLLCIGIAFLAYGDGPQGASNLRASSTVLLMFCLIWERSGFRLAILLILIFSVIMAGCVKFGRRKKDPVGFWKIISQGIMAMVVAAILDVLILVGALYAAPRGATGLYRDPSERPAGNQDDLSST